MSLRARKIADDINQALQHRDEMEMIWSDANYMDSGDALNLIDHMKRVLVEAGKEMRRQAG